MARQVERNDAEILVDIGGTQLMPPFTPVRTRGVQAHERDPFTGFFVVNPVFLAFKRHPDIAPDDWFNFCHVYLPESAVVVQISRIRSSAQVNARMFCHMTI